MITTTPSLRKAAVLLRTLDAESAAAVLARLSPSEAKQVRLAMQSLGEIEEDERADVSAEFRRSGSVAQEDPRHGVELDLSSSQSTISPSRFTAPTAARPFEFLEQARVESLVPYLAREHAQTVAVVISYLAPARAAQVLAALPEQLQADAIERLSVLGDTDPSSLQVLERELADWVARQQATRTRPTGRIDTVAAILAAADQSARREILGNLVKHNRELAQQLAPQLPKSKPVEPVKSPMADVGLQLAELKAQLSQFANPGTPSVPQPEVPRMPTIQLDDLARFDESALSAVLKSVDAEVLVLALVGASEPLVQRITSQMPSKVAKLFRQRLSNTGPTRLRDVETAQQEVCRVAAQILHARRSRAQTARA